MKTKKEKIIEALEEQRESYSKPGGYMEEEWYVKCAAKAEAFEEAIDIVKNCK